MTYPNQDDELPTPAPLEAGREMDALVAITLFGWKWFEYKEHPYRYLRPAESFRYGAIAEGEMIEYSNQLPHFSTDIAAAWEVANHFVKSGCAAWIEGDGHTGWSAGVTSDRGRFESFADTAPLAICRAARQAVAGR